MHHLLSRNIKYQTDFKKQVVIGWSARLYKENKYNYLSKENYNLYRLKFYGSSRIFT